MRISKWAHASYQNQGLLIYELWREGGFRVIRGLYGENGPKKSRKVANFCLKNLSSPGKMAKNGYELVCGIVSSIFFI